jgi:multidrug efflux pump subunit AcrB
MNLVEISIKRPIVIIVLYLVLGLLGAFSYTNIRVWFTDYKIE